MLPQAEKVGRLMVFVPIAANAFEYARAVVEAVRHYADLGLGKGHDLLSQVGVRRRHEQRS